MTNAPIGRPVTGNERLVMLDSLRGLALCGVFLANISYWSHPLAVGLPEFPARTTAELAAAWEFVFKAFVEGKFYSIFSLLFGLGFSLQLHRLEQRGADGSAIFRRRLFILLLIGLTHMQFVWEGDILTLYALLGLTLPMFARLSDRNLLLLAMGLIALPVLMAFVQHRLGLEDDLGVENLGGAIFASVTATPEPAGDADVLRLWSSGSWEGFVAWQLSGPPYRLGVFISEWRPFKVMAMMLIGLVAGRHIIRGTLLNNASLLKRIAIWGFAVGLPASILFGQTGGLRFESPAARLESFTIYAISVAPLALGYAALFALAWQRLSRSLGVFASLGRMALTNYLVQSVVSTILFWGVFFGLSGKLGPWETWALAILLLFIQILFSNWWLRHHEQGPLEKLWRMATYRSR